jgi:2-oxoglutarate dehydrogenase E2 component (dihydrolipoamide succinyltransferase)
MSVAIKVPSVGESITEGNLVRWLKKDGEAVRMDEPLFELETEKASTEIPAPATGQLQIAVPAGQAVAIGAVVGSIEEKASKPAGTAPPPARPNDQAKREEATPSQPTPRDETLTAAAGGDARPLSPAARRLVEEARVDVRQIAGSGRGGRITKDDVQTFLSRQPPAAPAEPSAAASETAQPEQVLSAASRDAPDGKPPRPAGRETRQPMSAIRLRIAERLVAAQQTAAILTTFNEADMSAVIALRAQYKDQFKEKHGVGLGFMSFFVKACVEALRAFPLVNARIDGTDIVHPNAYHIAVAVSTDRGLMVPVVRDADRLSFAQLEKAVTDLAARARDGKLTVGDLQGGTFTITNGGIFGSLLSTPILNPPQSGILGMHAIQKRPMAVGDEVVVRPMMYLALSYDHRLVDGREAVQFLVRVKECIEKPERLLLEV